MPSHSFTPHEIKLAVLCTSLAGQPASKKDKPNEKYNSYLNEITEQLGTETIVGIEPFLKKGDSKPAGYVIKTSDRIIISYHGTSNMSETLNDLKIIKSKRSFGSSKVGIHLGFKKEYEASLESRDAALQRLRGQQSDLPITLTGHSLGGALSQIAALDLSTRTDTTAVLADKMQVITFGGPRVFSAEAAQLYNDQNLSSNTLRVKQEKDPIPALPPKGLYAHVGLKITIPPATKTFFRSVAHHRTATYRGLSKEQVTQDTLSSTVRESYSMRPPRAEIQKPFGIGSYVDAVKQYISRGGVALKASVKQSANNIINRMKKSTAISSSTTNIPIPTNAAALAKNQGTGHIR